MTTPSNSTFYQWGYHDPGKDPILPLSDDQKKILERVITVDGGTVRVGSELLPSGEGFDDPSRFYNIALDQDVVDEKKSTLDGIISAPALYPHDPKETGLRIDRGNYYFSSGNYTVWPSPDGPDRYSAHWWDASGIYFSPDIHGELYYACPLYNDENAASIVLFDDLDHEAYFNTGQVKVNESRKYLLWLEGKNIDQMGIFNFGRNLNKIVKIPLGYDKRNRKLKYENESRKYYYSHFSNADHDKVDKGFEDFQIFYTYIHYIPRLKGFKEGTHEKVVEDLSNLNEIPFLSNARSVYLYSTYGAGKFRNLTSQNWTGVNIFDNVYSPERSSSNFHNVLSSPVPPFPQVDRDDTESEEEEYNSKEELQEKFNAVSGLLGL